MEMVNYFNYLQVSLPLLLSTVASTELILNIHPQVNRSIMPHAYYLVY